MQTEIALSNFADLMQVAVAHGPAQRLLLVGVRAERMYRRTAAGGEEPIEGEGTLTPVMVRDRALEAGLTFAELRTEADATGQSWDFLMVGILPGQAGEPPSSADAEPHLKRMAKALLIGADLGGYAFFDRDGDAVQVGGGDG